MGVKRVRLLNRVAVLVRSIYRIYKLLGCSKVASTNCNGDVSIARDVNAFAASIPLGRLFEPRTKCVSVESVPRQLVGPEVIAHRRTAVTLRLQQLDPRQHEPEVAYDEQADGLG